MDLRKIGKFIAKKRQAQGFTQESLAEELDVSNRSVSKWERGICLPDAENMTKLCKVLAVNYNELLSGRELDQAEYERLAEANLKTFSKIETAQNKKLFLYENVLGYMSVTSFLILVFVAGYAEMATFVRVILILLGLVLLLVGGSFCLKIETETGKYECKHCKHAYIPKYLTVYFAPHFGRTRYMTCPKCHQKSWQKKLI